MAKRRSDIKSVKAPQKKTVFKSKEKLINLRTTKKQTLNKEVEILDGVDSLVFLKDTKETKKLNDIDDKIMLLKCELKSLMSDAKHSKDCESQDENDLWNLCKVVGTSKDRECSEITENSKSLEISMTSKIKDFKPSFNSTPHKLTECLDKTVDETDCQLQSDSEKLQNVNNLPLTSELEKIDSTFNRVPTCNKVEELLYKTFVLQNCGLHLSDLYDSGAKKISFKCNAIQDKCSKTKRNSIGFNKENPIQGKIKHRSVSKSRKKRILSLHTSQSDVEVINLDTTIMDEEIPRAEPSCIDLDVSNYDWTEPFDVDEGVLHADVQNSSEARDAAVNNEVHKSDSRELNESNEGSHTEKLEPKKVWECPVCFEQSKGQEIVATQCGHVFCKTCLETHTSKISNNCPTCRTDLKRKPFITLFNF